MSTKKTFIIQYQVADKSGAIIQEGKIRAKNKISPFAAKCGLEDYLKKKHRNMEKLVVLSCKEEIFNSFKDIFGKNFGDVF